MYSGSCLDKIPISWYFMCLNFFLILSNHLFTIKNLIMKNCFCILSLLLLVLACNDIEPGIIEVDALSFKSSLKRSINFENLVKDFGIADFDNMVSNQDTTLGVQIIGIPLVKSYNSQNVLVVTIRNNELLMDKLFVGSLEAFDQDFRFDSVDKTGFIGTYKTFNVSENKYDMELTISKNPQNFLKYGVSGLEEEICETVRCTGCSGDVCTADNVGGCTGYKFCSQGFFEAVACFAGFPACMISKALDCQYELCWDDDESNDHIY